jgi:hypothetical protein
VRQVSTGSSSDHNVGAVSGAPPSPRTFGLAGGAKQINRTFGGRVGTRTPDLLRVKQAL